MLAKVGPTLADSILARAAALGLAYWLTVVLAIELVSPVDKIALFWPPNALAAAALIFSSRKHWPLYLIIMALAYFAARVPAGHLPLYVYFGFCAANITEVLIVAGMVKRLIRDPVNYENLTKVLTVATLASVPASIVSALIGGIFVTSGVEKASFVNASVGWFTGDLSGLLLVLPALLTWLTPGASPIKSYNKGEIIEHIVIASIYVGIGLLTPVYLAKDSQIILIFPYLVFPVLIWTAIRMGLRSATAATLAVGLFAIGLTYLGQGPFSIGNLSAFNQVVLMKIGLITITLTTIFLAVVVRERVQTEKAHRESEDLLNSIIENVPVGLLIKDPDHIVERANDTYLRWYGFDADTMAGRRSDEIEDFQSSEEAEFMNTQEREVLTTGRTKTRQVDRLFADGQIHTIDITKFPVYDQQSNITKVGSVSVDLTDLKKGERELKSAQDQLGNIISNLPGGIYRRVLRTDGTEYLEYNMGQLPQALGVEARLGESSLKFVSDFTFPEYRKVREEAVRKSADKMAPCVFEYPIRMPDKSIIWVQSVSVPHRRKNGEIVWDGLNLEITERKRAEDALKESQARLVNILDNSPAPIYFKDTEGRFLIANRRYQEMYNVKFEDIKGKTSKEIFGDELGDMFFDHDREVLNSLKAIEREENFLDRTYLTLKFPIVDPNGVLLGLGGIETDVTEIKAAEKGHRLALAKAEEANQAKSEFLASMSHELRTPLNAILGFSQVLSQKYFGSLDEEKYQEYAGDIQASSEHLLTLVNDILDLSAIESGEKELTKEQVVVKEIFADCSRIILDSASRSGIKYLTKVPKDLPLLYADKRALKQILLNLLSNAVKFTPVGGKITMSVTASKKQHTIKVSDTGKGVPDEKLPKLTDPFKRVNTDPYVYQEGTGLGLTIVQSLVNLHGGTLDIKSTVGKGTTVTVKLPNGAP